MCEFGDSVRARRTPPMVTWGYARRIGKIVGKSKRMEGKVRLVQFAHLPGPVEIHVDHLTLIL